MDINLLNKILLNLLKTKNKQQKGGELEPIVTFESIFTNEYIKKKKKKNSLSFVFIKLNYILCEKLMPSLRAVCDGWSRFQNVF